MIYDGKHEPIISVELFNSVQKLFNQSKARTHDRVFTYQGLLTCGHCGCQMTAELKKGRYVYYHCTGKRGGNCKKDYVREEKLDEVFMDLISRIPQPRGEVYELIKQVLKKVENFARITRKLAKTKKERCNLIQERRLF